MLLFKLFIVGTNKELMRKVPKFIYDEEKALEVIGAYYWYNLSGLFDK